jgi:fatty acyl-CoA reductase
MTGLSVNESLRGKSILLTGSTGFIGKVIVSKILKDIPEIKELCLLIRGNAKERIEKDITSQALFEGTNLPFEKLRGIRGDMMEPNLGVGKVNPILCVHF